MRYRVRLWAGDQPLPALDVSTNSEHVALSDVRAHAAANGWESVSLIEDGQRGLRGDELRAFVERTER